MNLNLHTIDSGAVPDRFAYLKDNWDWKAFCDRLSDDTCDDLTTAWINNVRSNKSVIRQKGSAYRFRGIGKGKATIIIGASPALSNNMEYLKRCDDNFIMVAASSALKQLLSKGIRPKFIMLADGAENVSRYVNVGDEAKGLTLIASCFVHPRSLNVWKGNVRFLRVGIGNGFESDYRKMTGIKDMFPAGGNQFNLGVLFSYMVLQSKALIFVGCELAYKSQYYADRTDEKDDKFEKFPALDIHGNAVMTNLALYQAKLYLENQLGQWDDGIYINATEDGILGMTARYGRLPWIRQYLLTDAIDFTKRALNKTKEVIYNG